MLLVCYVLVFACFVPYIYCFDLVWNYISLLFFILLYFHISLVVKSCSSIVKFILPLLSTITWSMSCFSWGYFAIMYIVLLFSIYSCFLRLHSLVIPAYLVIFLLYWTLSSVSVLFLIEIPALVYFFQLNLILFIVFSNYYVFCLSYLEKVLLLIHLLWTL